jgi:hypothetical protein
MPTPSFTSEPISTGNIPGDFKPFRLIFIGLVGALLILFLFSE